MNARPGVMRVTGGSLAGRRLHAPRGESTRPTSARAREGLFAWLGPLDDAHVLDLFAGTGALGIEALSRGAANAVFVERDRAALSALRRNLESLELAARASVLPGDVVRVAEHLGVRGVRFDLVVVDPPYAQGLPDPWRRVQLARLLDHDATLVVERRTRRPDTPQGAQKLDGLLHVGSRSYGQTTFDRYERDESSQEGRRT